jgi:hypothetical protein
MRPAIAQAIALAILASHSATAAAEKAIEIPLKDVWAYQMPGTRDVRELEAERFGDAVKKLSSEDQLALSSESLISQILHQLGSPPKNKPKARPAFAVAGTGRQSLQAACQVLAHGAKPPKSFSPNDDITVVFFSCEHGAYVHLHDIRIVGSTVEISYQFVPHRTKELTRHFAIIPLGRMPSGMGTVNILRMPFDKKFASWGIKPITEEEEDRLISRPFEFVVERDRRP